MTDRMDRRAWAAVLLTFVLAGCATAGPGTATPEQTTALSEESTVDEAAARDRTDTAAVTTRSESGEFPTETNASTTTERRTTPTGTDTPTPSPTTTATPSMSERSEWRVTVVRVVDGDTFEVRFPDGHTENVRLLGVDTPEVHVENDPAEFEGIPTTRDGHDWLRDWGHRASEFARTELAGERVTIRTDPRADRRGSYGRLLVYVNEGGGKSFNLKLIEQGYARMYDSEFSKRTTFASAEATARRNDAGLWGYEAAQTTTATPSPIPTRTATPTPNAESTADGDLPPRPADGDYDCSHFDSQEQAQRVYDRDTGDPHRLDADDDGTACESLP